MTEAHERNPNNRGGGRDLADFFTIFFASWAGGCSRRCGVKNCTDIRVSSQSGRGPQCPVGSTRRTPAAAAVWRPARLCLAFFVFEGFFSLFFPPGNSAYSRRRLPTAAAILQFSRLVVRAGKCHQNLFRLKKKKYMGETWVRFQFWANSPFKWA